MVRESMPAQADFIILIASLMVVCFQFRKLYFQIWQARVPRRLKRQIIFLLGGSANWGNLVVALGLSLESAAREILKYVLTHPIEIAADFLLVYEIFKIIP